MYYFVNGDRKPYEGPRDANGIVEYLRKRELPAVKVMKEEEVMPFVSALDNKEFALIAHVKNKSARQRALYYAVEQHLIDYSVSKIWFVAVLLPQAANPKNDAKLVLHRPGFSENEGKLATFMGSWSSDSMAQWVKQNTYQRIGAHFMSQYHWKNIESLGWNGVVSICIDHSKPDIPDAVKEGHVKPTVLEAVAPLVDKYPKWKFTFCELSSLKNNEKKMLGLAEGSEFVISVVRGERKRFVLEGAENIQNKDKLEKFLADVSAGKLKPHYKSEPKPQSATDVDGVTVLTGDTFEDKVLNPKSDVFVEFYAPWCGHCKKLAPIWADLAKKAKTAGWDTRGIVIAKMDATANECEEEVTGFPTMVLYPAVRSDRKMKQKLLYSGARELGQLTEFLLENAKNLDGVEYLNDNIKGRMKVKSMVQRELEKRKSKAKDKFEEF